MADTTTKLDWRSAARPRAGTPRGRSGPLRQRARIVVPLCVLAFVVLAAAFVPMLLGGNQNVVDYDAIRQAPSWSHPLGTDGAGRDVAVRTALGARVSLVIAVCTALLATLIGTAVGVVSGALGGRFDRLVMRVVDGVNAVPHLLLGILIVALYRGSVLAVAISIAVTHWTTVARIVRAQVLSLRTRPYVEAAISTGASRWKVIRTHLVPAVAPQCAVAATLLLPHAVFHETTLSFLGLGLPAHLPSLGTMTNDARGDVLLGVWWTLGAPTVALVLTTLAVAGVSGWWRDRLVPRRRTELDL